MDFILITLLTFVAVFVFVEFARGLRAYLKFRGKRIVSCPENHCGAAVSVAAGRAAYETIVGTEQFRLSECSRWPEKQSCGQECLQQIEDDPEGCLVWTIMNQWYQAKDCAYCHMPFTEICWHDHPPALRNAKGKTFQWNEVPAENLQEILKTHKPVCWDCHIAETFRREHPEMVVDRHPDSRRMTLYH